MIPISNTNSVEVRKYKDDFLVKENILKLYKKEVVIKSEIKNNLYSSRTLTPSIQGFPKNSI